MKEKLIEIGFIYYPFVNNVNGVFLPIEHELFGQYIYLDACANFILEINAFGWNLYDGRPDVDKIYYEAKDISIDYMVRLLIRSGIKQAETIQQKASV